MTKDLKHLCELALLKLDGEITADQVQELDRLLRDRDDAQQLYLEIMAVCSGLAQHAQFEEATAGEPAAAEEAANTQALLEEQRIIKERADQQLQAFLAEQAEMRRQQDLCASRQSTVDVRALGVRVLRTLDRAVAFTRKAAVRTAAIAAILFVVLAGYRHYTRSRPIATLGRTQDAVWEKAPESEALLQGRLVLKSGYAQIRFTSGAEILVEGPCALRLDAAKRMYLDSGSISAQVPPEAVGFTVCTPSSMVKDFGTELGVAVDAARDSEIHVFAGEVGVQIQGARRVPMQHLKRGQVALAGITGTFVIGRISSRTKRFVRHLAELEETEAPVRYLNLADVVGGGTGFGTGQLDWGISPYTGMRTASTEHYTKAMVATPNYAPVPWLAFVDGVFVPNRYEQPLPVSQTGFQFAWPSTDGTCYSAICNGARFGKNDSAPRGKLRGQVVGIPGAPVIRMHANAGITFDLQAIRAANPETTITRFGAICGIAEVLVDDEGVHKSEFWVLVDGQQIFHKVLIRNQATVVNVDIPLDRDDRFLTLATTDSGSRRLDHCLFAEPTLELVPKESLPEQE